MEKQVINSNKSPSALMWIVGLAIILACGVGIAAIMGWIPSSTGNADVAKANMNNSSVRKNNTAPPQVSARVKCAECGVVESVVEINTKGKGTGIGVVGGAVVGGLLGNQVGKGRGNDAATVVGAVGGAVAGNQIEKSARSTKSYDITIRFEDGSRNVIHDETNPSAWRVGDRVKVVNGTIRSNN